MKKIIQLAIAITGIAGSSFGQPTSLIGTDIIKEKTFFIHYSQSKYNWSLYGMNHFGINKSNDMGGMARVKWGNSFIQLNTKIYSHASSDITLTSLNFGRWINPKLSFIAGFDYTRWLNEDVVVPLSNLHIGLQYFVNGEYSFRLNAFNLAPSKTKYLAPAHFEWILRKTWGQNFTLLIPIQKTLGSPLNVALDIRYRPDKRFTTRMIIQPMKESFAFEGSYLLGHIELIIGSDYNLQLGPSPYFNFRSSMILL